MIVSHSGKQLNEISVVSATSPSSRALGTLVAKVLVADSPDFAVDLIQGEVSYDEWN
jgi:hypothetical protein